MKNVLKSLNYLLQRIMQGFYKVAIAPRIYGKKDDYDAQKYWSDRFSKYGLSLKGAGHEGISEVKNELAYAEAKNIFLNICSQENIDFSTARILEVGCGTGFYTQILSELGTQNYLGIDITNVLFPELKQMFPHFDFIREDITTGEIQGEFDVIIMIDVIEHIVNEDKFTSAMENIKCCLSDSGVFIIAPLLESNRQKKLFYVNFWSINDLKSRFKGYAFSEPVPFRNGYIMSIKDLK